MAQIGTLEAYTESNGWIEIALYEPADLDFTPVEVHTASGWGCPYITSTASADTPFEIYTETNGWMGLNTVGHTIIDNFDDGTLNGWRLSTEENIDPTSARSAWQGDYGVKIVPDKADAGDYDQIVSMPSYSDALPHYPAPGETFDLYLRGHDGAMQYSDQRHGVMFGIQNGPSSDGFSSDAIYNHYYLVALIDENGINRFRLIREDSNSGTTIADSTDITWSDNEWYRFEVDWMDSTSNIVCTVYGVRDDGSEYAISQIESGDSTYGQGGIALSANIDFDFDYLKKTSPL